MGLFDKIKNPVFIKECEEVLKKAKGGRETCKNTKEYKKLLDELERKIWR